MGLLRWTHRIIVRNRIGIFCVFESGPTWNWGMGGAQYYLAGRSYARIYTG